MEKIYDFYLFEMTLSPRFPHTRLYVEAQPVDGNLVDPAQVENIAHSRDDSPHGEAAFYILCE